MKFSIPEEGSLRLKRQTTHKTQEVPRTNLICNVPCFSRLISNKDCWGDRLFRLWSCLQVVRTTPRFQLSWVTYTRVGCCWYGCLWVIPAPVSSPYPPYKQPKHIHWFTKLNSGVGFALTYFDSLCGVITHLFTSPQQQSLIQDLVMWHVMEEKSRKT